MKGEDFHYDDHFLVNFPKCSLSTFKIGLLLQHGELVEKQNFLPEGPITVGITAGASTPHKVILCSP